MLEFVTDRIAVGSVFDAADLELLGAQGITGVLNVAIEEDPPAAVAGSGVEYRRAGLRDGGGNPPEALQAALRALAELLSRHPKVLVHCQAGISRAPTVVAAHLAWEGTLSFPAALDRVMARRRIASPHPALCRLAARVLDGDARPGAGGPGDPP